jgi:UDP-N-acetylglucosamine acyltransferase
VNSVGLRRRGYSDDEVREIEDIYRTIYINNNVISKGVQQVLDTMPQTAIRDQILGFIHASDKGVIKGMI